MEKHCPEITRGKSLDAMSTASIQALLQAEMDSDQDVDVDLVSEILAVLGERTEQKPVDVDAAWRDFLQDHLPAETICSMEEATPGKGRKRWIRIALIAAICAALLLGASVTASAVGYDLWDAVGLWSSETFGFSFGEGITSPRSDPEYADLKAALADDGITTPLVPNYLPEGFTQAEFHKESGQYVAVYENDPQTIIIQIQEIEQSIGLQLERDSSTADTYRVHGVDHFISTNQDMYLAAWASDGYECFISGVPTRQDLLSMIDSIYLEESQ